ncbi:S1 family peptidase [Actinokineospora auranticolor]|uniref:Streptogrisin C n=1 Tax=Actinokineospora auranticolor TaxID=155976 RepID=A0A2S6GQV0_9PSEU|nr:S1 family peptidase [Actinokineospora auranticolor]PPK67604.1 streptogrisin C [Actinokineospora auranticolor]
MRVLATLCALVLIVLTAPSAAAAPVQLIGGDRITYNGKTCVIGFNARTGSGVRMVITTSACGGGNQAYGLIPAPADSVSTPYVRTGTGTTTVRGRTEAAVGTSVCRYGPTTGWHCGTVQAKNQTVNFPGGSITGLTRTTICVEPGDAGGPVVWNGQAQGVVVGGSGNCSSGGTSYYLPIATVLSRHGLVLYTG